MRKLRTRSSARKHRFRSERLTLLSLCWTLPLACILLSLAGCGNGARPGGIRTQLFVSFRSLEPSSVRIVGKPYTQWIDVSGAEVPGILGERDFAVWIQASDLADASVRGLYGFWGAWPRTGSVSATFRVQVSASPDSPGDLLFEDTIDDRVTEGIPFVVRIPAAWREGFVGLSVAYVRKPPHAGPPHAVWIDPALEIGVRVLNTPGHRPNVLLITADTTRWDDLEVYGGPAKTPALVELAADGVLFERRSRLRIAGFDRRQTIQPPRFDVLDHRRR